MDRNQIGPFMLLEKLGEGGMGVVYKARDTRLERFVAIKLLPEARVTDADRRARFMQEARAASALNHPNIIAIYDIVEEDSRHYIVMEFVDGKPLQDLIPRKGMRITEALRIATQIADALTAAHAAGIVHRDLKPANIMVDAGGRAKVLDFGLAKLTAPAAPAPPADDETRTVAMNAPRTEEGVIMGSVPYMSPEQAEGRAVDARSDIFSFGAVLYEMVTGRRAFAGESRISTLAAVVERDPQTPSEVVAGVPAELERVIARCLRKDVARRSQHMSDVKLALEELRDESESGKLVRPSGTVASAPAAGRRWLWPVVAAAFAVIAVAAVVWSELRHRETSAPAAAQLVRVTPDDGYSYTDPAISPDGKFVAAVSDRGGTPQLWLQQVGGGDPIQVTHSAERVQRASFFPDGTRLLVSARVDDGSPKSVLEIVPTLGGQSRVLHSTQRTYEEALSPDGRQVAYVEWEGQLRLAVLSTEEGMPRIIEKWDLTQGQVKAIFCAWMPDGRTLLVLGTKRRDAPNLDDWDLFALPVDGGDPVAMGAGDALRAAGFGLSQGRSITVAGDRLLIPTGRDRRTNVWQLRFTPGSWRVSGVPRQLTFGTENESVSSVSTTGLVAVESSKQLSDFYLLPLDPATGQPSAPTRRLTKDGRSKAIRYVSGASGALYFDVFGWGARGPSFTGFAIDLATLQQSPLYQDSSDLVEGKTVSADGRWIAYSRPDGNAYSISVGDVGSARETARPVCNRCGFANRFSPDRRYLLITPESRLKPDPMRKSSLSLLEVSSGKVSPWLMDAAESVTNRGFLDGDWVLIDTQLPGQSKTQRHYVVKWRSDPIPRSEWAEYELPYSNSAYSPFAPFIYGFQDSRLMGMRFDPKQRKFSEPFPVRLPSGSAAEIRPSDTWSLRGPGITFSRQETKGSVWLMKLPE